MDPPCSQTNPSTTTCTAYTHHVQHVHIMYTSCTAYTHVQHVHNMYTTCTAYTHVTHVQHVQHIPMCSMYTTCTAYTQHVTQHVQHVHKMHSIYTTCTAYTHLQHVLQHINGTVSNQLDLPPSLCLYFVCLSISLLISIHPSICQFLPFSISLSPSLPPSLSPSVPLSHEVWVLPFLPISHEVWATFPSSLSHMRSGLPSLPPYLT